VGQTLREIGVETIQVDLPHGCMHLMGTVRIVDGNLAYCRANRTPWTAVQVLREMGYEVRFFPDEGECRSTMGHNFVVLGPRKILVPAGNPTSVEAYESAGVECVVVEVDELAKGAGAIGCLTGVVHRESVD
jgi:N-dimethylarginine dimethylaminohydrolase